MRIYISASQHGHLRVSAPVDVRAHLEFPPKGDRSAVATPARFIEAGETHDLYVWPGIKLVIEDAP